MLDLNKVAVTGALSCGKSSVCRVFEELGAYVVSADEIVHKLLSPNSSLGKEVIKLLGHDIVVNEQIDRSVIAKRVFCNRTLLHSLEKILHPATMDEVERQYHHVKSGKAAPLFVAEIPLLYEIGAEGKFDCVIDIWAESEACRKRFKIATGYGDEEYDRRMARQILAEEKAQRADYVINNSGSMQDMRNSVLTVFNDLRGG